MLENNEISPVWLQNPKIFILFMTFESLNYSVMQLVIYFSATYYIPDFIYVPNSTHPRLEVGEFMFPVMFLCILVAHFSPFPPLTTVVLVQESGPTALTCPRPPVTPTAWSTVRSHWSCAVTVQTADNLHRSPARSSTTPAVFAPTMKTRFGGRFVT